MKKRSAANIKAVLFCFMIINLYLKNDEFLVEFYIIALKI